MSDDELRKFKTKSGTIWKSDLRFNGERIRRSFGRCTRPEAQRKLAELKVELYAQADTAVHRIRGGTTWQDAKVKWLKAHTRKASDVLALRLFDRVFANRLLKECTSEVIEAALDKLAAERQWAPGTYNRNVNRLVAIANLSGHSLKIAKRQVPKSAARVRVLSAEEWELLKAACQPHMRPMVIFALYTGLRQFNVTHLRWDHVDLKREMLWVDPIDAKEGDPIQIPLSDEAIEILRQQQLSQEQTPCAWVFPYCHSDEQRKAVVSKDALRMRRVREQRNEERGVQRVGQPITNVNHAWHLAMERAGLGYYERWTTPDGKAHERWHGDVVWHTLRHTWASWQRVAGTPLADVQELGGWRDPRSVKRYAHVNVDHLRKAAKNIKPWDREEDAIVVPIRK